MRRKLPAQFCQLLVRRATTGPESPAPSPKNSDRAGTKSPVESPCRYSSGNTAETCGLRRHHGSRIELWNLWRSTTLPVDPLVVDPRCGDLDGAGDRLHGAGLDAAVAHDEPRWC